MFSQLMKLECKISFSYIQRYSDQLFNEKQFIRGGKFIKEMNFGFSHH